MATKVFQNLKRRFADSKSALIGDQSLRTSDKYLGALCIFRKGRFLVGYTNSSQEREAVEQARRMVAHIP